MCYRRPAERPSLAGSGGFGEPPLELSLPLATRPALLPDHQRPLDLELALDQRPFVDRKSGASRTAGSHLEGSGPAIGTRTNRSGRFRLEYPAEYGDAPPVSFDNLLERLPDMDVALDRLDLFGLEMVDRHSIVPLFPDIDRAAVRPRGEQRVRVAKHSQCLPDLWVGDRFPLPVDRLSDGVDLYHGFDSHQKRFDLPRDPSPDHFVPLLDRDSRPLVISNESNARRSPGTGTTGFADVDIDPCRTLHIAGALEMVEAKIHPPPRSRLIAQLGPSSTHRRSPAGARRFGHMRRRRRGGRPRVREGQRIPDDGERTRYECQRPDPLVTLQRCFGILRDDATSPLLAFLARIEQARPFRRLEFESAVGQVQVELCRLEIDPI